MPMSTVMTAGTQEIVQWEHAEDRPTKTGGKENPAARFEMSQMPEDAYSLTRSTTAPQRVSFSSRRSKPRSRW